MGSPTRSARRRASRESAQLARWAAGAPAARLPVPAVTVYLLPDGSARVVTDLALDDQVRLFAALATASSERARGVSERPLMATSGLVIT